MTEPQTTLYHAYPPPPPPAIQPTRPYIKWPHPRSPLWKTWNVDDVPSRPPLPPRRRAAGSSWIYDLPDFGADKLKRAKAIATALVATKAEAWRSKESLALVSNSEIVDGPSSGHPEEEANISDDVAVLNPSHDLTGESEDAAMHIDSDSEEPDAPISTANLSRIVEVEKLETTSLDYGMAESQDSQDDSYQSLWSEVYITESSHHQAEDLETLFPDPISSDSSSNDSWPSDDDDDDNFEYSNNITTAALPMTLHPLEQNIHIHFPRHKTVSVMESQIS
ncbi:hypothetical protein HYFRA_00003033 [Hymenoscyphus fraxineus]|uniref:Uncharacterized protein n=1 Tax=Hymenoscyphus fraxineus TaxID=746836 RepID=A0A9N9KSK5_9HELO|nr:hypothetical protein HYFRA_00003033 [Hymenoscyphus fraxineus]